jgi:hypothetical protein
MVKVKKWAIKYAGPGCFELYDAEGIRVLMGPVPKKLSIHAFVNGADEVTWAFDLKLAE